MRISSKSNRLFNGTDEIKLWVASKKKLALLHSTTYKEPTRGRTVIKFIIMILTSSYAALHICTLFIPRYSKFDAFLLLVNTSYHAPFVEFLPLKASNVFSPHRGSMSSGIQLTLKYFREEKVNEIKAIITKSYHNSIA